MKEGISCLTDYSDEKMAAIRRAEDRTDHYEDVIGSYLVKLSAGQLGDRDSTEAAKLLKCIGDFERIGDHALNLAGSGQEMRSKNLTFSSAAAGELRGISAAVEEILVLTLRAFETDDRAVAATVEPLEQVIDRLKERLRTNHILRLQQGNCSVETGFVWADILTDLERTSDHCSNIAGCVIDAQDRNMNIHASIRASREDAGFREVYEDFARRYL